MNKKLEHKSSHFQKLIRSVIVLYGKSNSGKTSTLMDLLMLLNRAFVKKFINTNLVKTNRSGVMYYQDAMFIFYYKEHLIFLSTFGDTQDICEANCHFFERKQANRDIYVIHNGTVKHLKDLSSTEKKSFFARKLKPSFCISACRTDGGPADAIMYFSKKVLDDVQNVVWIRKWRDPKAYNPIYTDQKTPIITADDEQLAKEIRNFIDRMIKNYHI